MRIVIDSHIHLDQYLELDKQIENWHANGITQVIAVSNDLPSSYRTLELQLKHPEMIKVCVGFHPEYPLPTQQDVKEWEQLVKTERKRIVGIGEIGLPHYQINNLSHTLTEYIDRLTSYLHIAKIHSLPVALHAVHDKAQMVLSLLQELEIKKAHFHWLKASSHVLEQIIRARYFISVTPEVCYRRRDQLLAQAIPLDQLLIETDGPWKYTGPFKSRQTSPLLLQDVVTHLSSLKNKTIDQIHTETTINTKRCYCFN